MSSRRHTPEQIINKLWPTEVEVPTDVGALGACCRSGWHCARCLLLPPAPGALFFPCYQRGSPPALRRPASPRRPCSA